jgi:hypothetical protein
MFDTMARLTRQWRRVPCPKSPTERRLTLRPCYRVLSPAGSPPPLCASLPDPPYTSSTWRPIPDPHPSSASPLRRFKSVEHHCRRSFPLPPLLPFPRREHLLAPLTSCPKSTARAAPAPPGLTSCPKSTKAAVAATSA